MFSFQNTSVNGWVFNQFFVYQIQRLYVDVTSFWSTPVSTFTSFIHSSTALCNVHCYNFVPVLVLALNLFNRWDFYNVAIMSGPEVAKTTYVKVNHPPWIFVNHVVVALQICTSERVKLLKTFFPFANMFVMSYSSVEATTALHDIFNVCFYEASTSFVSLQLFVSQIFCDVCISLLKLLATSSTRSRAC